MTDYELVQKSQMGDKSAELELWNKYEPLRIKKHNELLNLTNRKFDKEEYDEWTQTAYEKFKNLILSLNLRFTGIAFSVVSMSMEFAAKKTGQKL